MAALNKFIRYLFSGRFGMIGEALQERIPRWLYHRGKAYMFELYRHDAMSLAPGPVLPDGYTCRPASRDELVACSRITGHEVSEFYRRFDAGDICFGVFVESRPVNINWVHRGSCFVRGMGYHYEGNDKDRYIYGIMTDPAERGKGLYKNCLRRLAVFLFDEGAERLVQMVEDGNAPVLATLPQLGYKKTEEISHVTMLGIKRTKVMNLLLQSSKTHVFVSEPEDRFVI